MLGLSIVHCLHCLHVMVFYLLCIVYTVSICCFNYCALSTLPPYIGFFYRALSTLSPYIGFIFCPSSTLDACNVDSTKKTPDLSVQVMSALALQESRERRETKLQVEIESGQFCFQEERFNHSLDAASHFPILSCDVKSVKSVKSVESERGERRNFK